jgi:hypothetical protein
LKLITRTVNTDNLIIIEFHGPIFCNETAYPIDTGGGGLKLITHHLVPRSKLVELYLHPSICLHGVVLYYVIKHRENFLL